MYLEGASSGILAGGNGGLDYVERRLAFISWSIAYSEPYPEPQVRQDRLTMLPTSLQAQDELDQYLSEPPVDNVSYKADPVAWWRDVGVVRFPRLSCMAVDFLTIGSSSAGTERDFSSCRRIIAPFRSCLRRHTVAMGKCLQTWSKSGIYQSSIPLDLLEGDNWRQALRLIVKNLLR
jgi:hypothetical protein